MYKVAFMFGLTALLTACNMLGTDPRTVGADEQDPDFRFEYRLHKGVDCYMTKDCGFRIEIGHDGILTMWEDTGQLKQRTRAPFTEADRTELKKLLDEGGFFTYPDMVPNELSGRGRTTVTLTYVEEPGTSPVTIQAFLDEALFAFPEGFQSFEGELRQFLLRQANVPLDGGGSFLKQQ